ncbi:TPA: M23 family metallopeptidase [Vibrio vulnificus]
MNKLVIKGSVGIDGCNNVNDIISVQKAINTLSKKYFQIQPLKVDGSLGRKPEKSKTVIQINNVQKHIVNMIRTDGRIDPNGTSNKKINLALNRIVSIESQYVPILTNASFPLEQVPTESYTVAPRSFGSNRGARKHAGCDLYAKEGSRVFAMADGEIMKFYEFYGGTYALEVKHGKAVVRYGEISGRLADGVSIGAKIQQGQHIAYVGKVVLKSGWTGEMLHLEIYDGSATGILRAPLSESPYHRRKDLINPTDILNMAQKRLPS